jgi:hypothetical protein
VDRCLISFAASVMRLAVGSTTDAAGQSSSKDRESWLMDGDWFAWADRNYDLRPRKNRID